MIRAPGEILWRVIFSEVGNRAAISRMVAEGLKPNAPISGIVRVIAANNPPVSPVVRAILPGPPRATSRLL